jgi:hypothetical protein
MRDEIDADSDRHDAEKIAERNMLPKQKPAEQ